MINWPFYLCFADLKIRLRQAFYHFCSMDGKEFGATLMCSTGDCPVCDCPKDALDRTDVFYPLRNIERVKAAVYEAIAHYIVIDIACYVAYDNAMRYLL